MKDNDKIRLAVRVFLCANKGKWYNAKELCEFINFNGFGGRSGVSSIGLARLMNTSWLSKVGIRRQRKNRKNVWEYGVF